MSLTRFNDDPARIKKNTEESMYLGNYFISTPGVGLDLPFMEDPHIRMQYWGANLMTNARDIESELFGISRPLGRNYATPEHEYKKSGDIKMATGFGGTGYSTEKSFVEQSRATHPAWMFKDQDHTRWETPLLNPQANLEVPFLRNIQTRIIEKDAWELPPPSI